MIKLKQAAWRVCYQFGLKCFPKFKKKDTKPILTPYTLNRLSRIGTGEEREYFIENLGMLIASGMDVLEAMESIQGEIRTPQMKKVVSQMRSDIENGVPIWKTFSRTGFLPENIVSLIRIGEESGRLSENLGIVATQQQKARLLQSHLRTGMAYPLLVLSLTVFIGVGIAWFILPRLALVFRQLKLELPLITKVLLACGSFLDKYGLYAVPAFFILLVACFYFVFVFQKTRHIGQFLMLHFPVLKRLIQEIELSRFGSMLGMLLSADLSLPASLESLEQATPFRSYKRFYRFLRDQLDDGNTFFQAFSAYPRCRRWVPSPIQQMIVTAERSGGLSTAFLKIGSTYENKSENTTKVLSVLLEPILLVIIWGGVVSVALAVILPIYSLVGGINTHSSPQKLIEQPNDSELLAQAQPQSMQLTETDFEVDDPEISPPGETGLSIPNPLDEPFERIEMSGSTIVPKNADVPISIFAAPLPEASPVALASAGEELTILSATSEFLEVILPDQNTGWVERSEVQIIMDEQASPTPSVQPSSNPVAMEAIKIPNQDPSMESKDTVAVSLSPAVSPPAPVSEMKKITVNSGVPTLNIRKTPSVQGDILAKAHAGETYKYLVHENGWIQVEISPDNSGWVMEKYVSEKQE